MAGKDELQIQAEQLAEAWRRTLPTVMNQTDRADVQIDGADTKVLRVHIDTAGRQQYSFDFKVHYVDRREINVELADVEQDGVSVDEHTEAIQQLTQDYVRHLHECAQALHGLTHA
ncbi:hypothetical protein EBB07_26700 [Paenibacillaceae bacterium]|nr:hypothetical protein EBB07_26700 [Paenibacillaceae bacterium]